MNRRKFLAWCVSAAAFSTSIVQWIADFPYGFGGWRVIRQQVGLWSCRARVKEGGDDCDVDWMEMKAPPDCTDHPPALMYCADDGLYFEPMKDFASIWSLVK